MTRNEFEALVRGVLKKLPKEFKDKLQNVDVVIEEDLDMEVVKALGLGAKDPDEVKSPTFALMHIYPTHPTLYHFDLYRMESLKEVSSIGFEEFVNDPTVICCVEWPEKAAGLLPKSALPIRFQIESPKARKIILDC